MTACASTTSASREGARTLGKAVWVAGSRLVRGPSHYPAWERPSLILLLLSNAILYFYDIGVNGWANFYYSAAVQSGTMDAEAFFYGSSDWGNSITVDKPPLSLWVMGLSVRLFGFNPIAMVLPQGIMGIFVTWLIYKIIRRHCCGAAALFGALVFFTTPIVTLMSRYNNPDPLMLLLMTSAVWFVLRSIETGQARFFVMAGTLLGLAFMTKQFQGLLSVPSLGLAYLLLSPQRFPGRLGTLAAGAGALVVSGGLWVAIVDLIDADQRPYIGGSQSNSVFQLTLGYNGIERIAGSEKDPIAQQISAQFRTVSSDAGLFRLLNANYNQEASWLLFASLLSLVLLAVIWRQSQRRRALRALIVMSGLWLLTAFLLLCFMGNQIHTYYTAALAPPLSLVLGIALDALITDRRSLVVRVIGAAISLTALLTSWLILGGTELWPAWLPPTVLAAGVVSTAALLIPPPNRKVEVMAASLLGASLLFGPLLTSIHNVTVTFTGSNPVSGGLSRNPAGISHFLDSLRKNDPPWAHDIAFGRVPDPAVVDALSRSSGCTWAGASYASQTAARLQLASGRPVMPIGGFAGSDPAPTLDEFKNKVAAGEICYLVRQETFLDVQDPDSMATEISNWVSVTFPSEILGSTTVYQLTAR